MGVPEAFLYVSGLFAANIVWTRFFTQETLQKDPPCAAAPLTGTPARSGAGSSSGCGGAQGTASPEVAAAGQAPAGRTARAQLASTLATWKDLVKHGELRRVFALNGVYWASVAGANMTLLPLMLAGPKHVKRPAVKSTPRAARGSFVCVCVWIAVDSSTRVPRALHMGV